MKAACSSENSTGCAIDCGVEKIVIGIQRLIPMWCTPTKVTAARNGVHIWYSATSARIA